MMQTKLVAALSFFMHLMFFNTVVSKFPHSVSSSHYFVSCNLSLLNFCFPRASSRINWFWFFETFTRTLITKDNCQKTICFVVYFLNDNYKLPSALAEFVLSILLTYCHCGRAGLSLNTRLYLLKITKM